MLALLPPAAAQESPCDAIYDLGTGWDELAVELDEALAAEFTDADAERFEARIAERVPATRELADGLLEAGDEETAELAAQLHEDLDYLEEGPDFETALEDIDYLIETLDLIVEVCDEIAAGGEPPADTGQEA